MYQLSLILGTVVGAAGTVIGGFVAVLIGKRAYEPEAFLAFAGGMMVSVVVFDMLLESAASGGMLVMCAGTVAGGMFFALVSPLITRDQKPSLYSTGILVLAGIALHDFPEGLAIGSSLVQKESYAFSLSALMLIHNVPEGIAVALPLRLSGVSAGRVVLLALLTGLPTAGGALLGTALGQISGEMIATCIAFAGGAMLYISLKELIPAANHQNQRRSTLCAMLGICIGFFVTLLL